MLRALWSGRGSETVALFDVVQGSVGGALIVYRKNEQPLLRYAHRIAYEPRGETARDVEYMQKALRLLAERICTHALPQAMKEERGCRGIDRVVAFLGTPWATVRTLRHPVEGGSPTKITEAWLTAAAREALTSGRRPSDALLEESVLRVELNGYPTNDPCGKSARHVALSLFEATMDGALKDRIVEVLSASFHTHAVTLRSSLLSHFTVVRDHFESEDNFILLTVGSRVSELAVAREDALMATAQLDRGAHTLLQAAAARLHAVPEEAASVLAVHAGGGTHRENPRLTTELAALESEWHEALSGAFRSLKMTQGLPRTVFLSAPRSTRSWFTALLQSSALARHTLTREPLRVIALGGGELLRDEHIRPEVVPDGPLALEMLFLHKLAER